MPRKISAGLLMYRMRGGKIEFFLVHPGGPYFKNKDDGYWSIPKGEVNEGEVLFDVAIREFYEETGIKPNGPFFPLDSVKQASGKIVYAWAFQGEWDGFFQKSNFFRLEWPHSSGRMLNFPEIDKGEFFSYGEAKKKINSAQSVFLDRLISSLNIKY